MATEGNKFEPPAQSRDEDILYTTLQRQPYEKEPESRIEDLLIQLNESIISGGGGFTPTETQLAAMNSGIDSEKVEQISTNENNILLVANQSVNYNVFDIANTTVTPSTGASVVKTNNTITVTSTSGNAFAHGEIYIQNFKAGTYYFSCKVDSLIGQGDKHILVRETISTGNLLLNLIVSATGTIYGEFTVSSDITLFIGIYSCYTSNSDDEISISDIAIIPKTVYDAGFTDYQPYAMSNAELTTNKQDKLLTGYSATVTPTSQQTIVATDSVVEGFEKLDNNVRLNEYNISLLTPTVNDSGDAFTVGTDYTLCDACTLTIPAPANGQSIRVANILASLTFNNSAPRGIILSVSNSATNYDNNVNLLAKIESTEYLRLSAQCAFFNYSNKSSNIYVWVKSSTSAINRVMSSMQLMN